MLAKVRRGECRATGSSFATFHVRAARRRIVARASGASPAPNTKGSPAALGGLAAHVRRRALGNGLVALEEGSDGRGSPNLTVATYAETMALPSASIARRRQKRSPRGFARGVGRAD